MKCLSLVAFAALLITTKAYSQKLPCSSIMPESRSTFDTTQTRGLADNYYLWESGQKIYVKFLNGSIPLQTKIKLIAKEWEKYSNVTFSFITTGNSNIRINLDSKGGHNSMIGTLANSVSQSKKTMNLDTTDFTDESIRRIVLHEFGHILGLLHEHFSPLSGISWNKEVVYEELSRTNGWDTATVNENIFKQYILSYTNGTLYDSKSIMHYPIMPNWTTNHYSVDWNNTLSAGDKLLVGALYPFSKRRANQVPRFQISPIQSFEVENSKTKNGLSLYPKFNIATAGKEGTVIFIVEFYYNDGTPITVESEKYTINNHVATFKTVTLPANIHIQVNNTKRNFELYIPYFVFPLPPGKNNIQAKFSAFLLNNNELKLLSSSNQYNCILSK
jgi:serralysin